jgi:hypothetical protein
VSSASLGPPVAFAFRIVLVVLVPTLVTAAVAGPATRGLERAFDAVAEAAAGAAGRAAGVVGWRADAAGERRPSRLERQRREWEKKLALGVGRGKPRRISSVDAPGEGTGPCSAQGEKARASARMRRCS